MTGKPLRYVTIALTAAVAGAMSFVGFRPRAAELMATPRVGDDTIVVNQTHPTRLGAFLLDQYGRRFPIDTAIRYRWISGDSIHLTASGVVHCTDRREAVLRASFEEITRDLVVRCRPVVSIEAPTWLDLFVGDGTRDLSFVARGPDGRPVTELRGAVIVLDKATIAAEGTTIRPKRSGATVAIIQVGNAEARIPIVVYQLVDSFADISRWGGFAAMRVSLARGDTLDVRLPKAAFWVTYVSKDPSGTPPTIELKGDGSCAEGNGVRQRRIERGEYAKYCLTGNGAQMMIAHGNGGAARVTGMVAIRLM
jgi:hypothetical protein